MFKNLVVINFGIAEICPKTYDWFSRLLSLTYSSSEKSALSQQKTVFLLAQS